MAWTPLLLVLLIHCTGSVSSYDLNQPPSLSMRPGEVVDLTCRANNIGHRNVHWYQQKPSQAPRLIMYNDNNRPSGIPDRFSGSNSGNTVTITIRDAIGEDTAMYFCQLYDSDDGADSDINRELKHKLRPHLCHTYLQTKETC